LFISEACIFVLFLICISKVFVYWVIIIPSPGGFVKGQTNYDFRGNRGITYHAPDTNSLWKKSNDVCFQMQNTRGYLAEMLFDAEGVANAANQQEVKKFCAEMGFLKRL
jgi:hypothetical protein